MAFLDKAKQFAEQAKEMGEDAVATGKLKLKIMDEEKNIKEAQLQIGKIIVEKLDAGEEGFDQSIVDFYNKVVEAKKKIEEYKAEQVKLAED